MKKIILLTTLIISLSILLMPAFIFAQDDTSPVGVLKSGLEKSAIEGNIVGSGLESANLPTRIGTVINYLFSIIGVMALVAVIIGGVLWMMAGGNEEKVQRAVKFILGGIEGMIIIFMAYAILFVILATLRYATP